jgi:hypothetical protein
LLGEVVARGDQEVGALPGADVERRLGALAQPAVVDPAGGLVEAADDR